MTESEPSLTALERELIAYVEKLTEASEQSAIQFKELEEQLRTNNAERYQSIASSILCVMESQTHLTTSVGELAMNTGQSIPKQLKESEKALMQAVELIAMKN